MVQMPASREDHLPISLAEDARSRVDDLPSLKLI